MRGLSGSRRGGGEMARGLESGPAGRSCRALRTSAKQLPNTHARARIPGCDSISGLPLEGRGSSQIASSLHYVMSGGPALQAGRLLKVFRITGALYLDFGGGAFHLLQV